MSDEKREPFLRLTKDDFEIQTFAAGGPGGQHQNKTASGVRIVHHPSGAVGECRSTRSQLQNKRLAFQRLAQDPRLMKWIKLKMAEADGTIATAEAYADREIRNPDHTIVEVQVDGKWTPEVVE